MNIKQFRYALTLAEEKNFSKAAEVLNISQPSLSQYIKNIENEIGVKLFERSNGFVHLTDAGKVYIDSGKKILDIEHQMHNKFCDLSNYKTGTITVGISPHRSFHLMPSIIEKYKNYYQDIEVNIIEKSGSDLLDCAEHGEFDVFVTTLPIDNNVFDYEMMIEEEIVLAISKTSKYSSQLSDNVKISENQSKKYPIVDVSILRDIPYVSLCDYLPMKNIENEIIKKYNISINNTVVCSSLECQLQMVKKSIGVALIPITMAESDEMNYYSLKQDLPMRKIVVAWRKDHYLSSPIKCLIDIMINKRGL